MLSKSIGLILVAALAVGGSGCGRKNKAGGEAETNVPGSAATAGPAQVLHLGNSAEPADLDPQITSGRPEADIQRALLEGLVTAHPETLAPGPGQAARWDISADGRVYTFHLRPDARWSNGQPVTAQDFVRSWQRILTPALGAEYAYNLYLVEGAEAYHQGRLTDFAQTGFKVIDARTLSITLRAPTGHFLNLLLHNSWYPVPIATVEAFGGLERKGTRWTRPENFVGNGPFALKEWKPNQVIVVERSETYWNRAEVRLERVHFHPTENADTQERMFRTGQLMIARQVPLTKVDVYRKENPAVLRIDPYLATAYVRVNVTRPQLRDPRVRRALALALDRERLCKNVLRGTKFPAHTLTPADTGGFTARAGFEDNVAAAQALLAEAGYPGGKGLPPIEVLYPTSDNGRVVMEAAQEMWRRNLGIDVRLLNQEWKVYLDSMNTLNFDIAWSAWVGDYADPMTFLDLMTSAGGNNRTGWKNADYDRLVAEAGRTGDREARWALFQQMESLLAREAPVLPLYFYANVALIDPRVKGWYPTSLDVHPLQAVWLEGDGLGENP